MENRNYKGNVAKKSEKLEAKEMKKEELQNLTLTWRNESKVNRIKQQVNYLRRLDFIITPFCFLIISTHLR